MQPGAGENLRRARGAPVRGRGHMGGAGKYIEMDRLDKVVNMEEGSRSIHKERAEMLGGAIDTAQADKAHARLKRPPSTRTITTRRTMTSRRTPAALANARTTRRRSSGGGP